MSEWQKVKLGDICNFIKGETGIAKAEAGEYPLVVTGKERKTCDSFQLDCKAVCIPLVSSSGHGKASLNYVHYQEGKFALGSILVAVIPKDENVINTQFLHLYLSRLKDSLLVPLMKGSANVALSVSAIKAIEISLPKIEKQIKIINLFNRIDLDHQELAKENTKQQSYLTQLRQAILQEAIEGKLTADWRVKNPVQKGNPDYDARALLATIQAEKQKLMADGKIKKEKPLAPINPDDVLFALPDGWVWVRLGEIIKISSGDGLTAKEMKNGSIPVFGGNGVNGFHDKYNVSQETIVIGRVGALCGSVHLTPEKAWITDNAFITTYSQHNLNREWLLYLLKNLDLRKKARETAQPVISGQKVYPVVFPLPPLAEQNAIVERVDRLLESVNVLEQQVIERKSYAEQLMQVVLKEAFTR